MGQNNRGDTLALPLPSLLPPRPSPSFPVSLPPPLPAPRPQKRVVIRHAYISKISKCKPRLRFHLTVQPGSKSKPPKLGQWLHSPRSSRRRPELEESLSYIIPSGLARRVALHMRVHSLQEYILLSSSIFRYGEQRILSPSPLLSPQTRFIINVLSNLSSSMCSCLCMRLHNVIHL